MAYFFNRLDNEKILKWPIYLVFNDRFLRSYKNRNRKIILLKTTYQKWKFICKHVLDEGVLGVKVDDFLQTVVSTRH